MKKNVLKIAALMTMCLVLIMGCGKSYGDKLYTCSSKNMLGFEGAYLSGDTITLHGPYQNIKMLFKNKFGINRAGNSGLIISD